MNYKQAEAICGTIGFPSKMPGTAYGLPARACLTGSKLVKVAGSVCHGCYALKGNYLYRDVDKSQRKRLEAISNPMWSGAMVVMLEHWHTGAAKLGKGRPVKQGWHRWHDSGDLQSVEHLTKICAVAMMTPKIWHWLPTRELAIVKEYIARGGIIPDNLLIRLSATLVDGNATNAWQWTSGVHRHVRGHGKLCHAKDRGGKCGNCRACWSKKIDHVSYAWH